MKTTYTIMAILASLLLTQTASAKLGENSSTLQLENNIELNIEAEIVSNFNEMLANVAAPEITSEITKQLGMSTVELHTNELVQDASDKLPGFKFKVVIAD